MKEIHINNIGLFEKIIKFKVSHLSHSNLYKTIKNIETF